MKNFYDENKVLIWAAAAVFAVHILFKCTAPISWLEATWSSGDFLMFAGTILLGYCVYTQTARADKLTQESYEREKNAQEISKKLTEMQQEEYLPSIKVESFAGITNFELSQEANSNLENLTLSEMRTGDNEVVLGYSINLPVGDLDWSKKSFVRSYQLNFRYKGKYSIGKVFLKNVFFSGNDFLETYELQLPLEMSLCDDDDFSLFIFLISNEDFLEEETYAYKYIKAQRIEFTFELTAMNGSHFTNHVTVRKHLVKKAEKRFNKDNVELPVSAVYRVENIVAVTCDVEGKSNAGA